MYTMCIHLPNIQTKLKQSKAHMQEKVHDFSPIAVRLIEVKLMHGDKTTIAKTVGTSKQTVDAAFKQKGADGITPTFRKIYFAALDLIEQRKKEDRKAIKKVISK